MPNIVRPTVLVIDDDSSFRELMQSLLSEWGYTPVLAERGREGLAKLDDSIDYVIVDGLLPDLNGIKVTEEIRSRGNNVPIVFVSSFWKDFKTFDLLTREYGVASVVHKPVQPDVLRTVLQNVFPLATSTGATEPATPSAENLDPLEQLRREYAAKLPELAGALRAALAYAYNNKKDKRALEQARIQAHTLAGTAGSYGFVEVGLSAKALENILVAIAGAPKNTNPEDPDGVFRWREANEWLKKLKTEVAKANVPARAPAKGLKQESILVASSDAGVVQACRRWAEQHDYGVIEVLATESLRDAVGVGGTGVAMAVVDIADNESDVLDCMLVPCKERTRRIPLIGLVRGKSHDVAGRALFLGADQIIYGQATPEKLARAFEAVLAENERNKADILIVDDDPDFLAMLAAMMPHDQVSVRTSTNAFDAVQQLEATPPDVLVMDVMLPKLSGLDICQYVRSTEWGRELPVLFLSARADTETRIAAYSAGADDYILKPVLQEELRVRLEARLSKMHWQREREEQDSLTGLLLRRGFVERAEGWMDDASRSGQTGAICILDIDHFKRVNDSYGHAAGDEVLRQFGASLESRFRRTDIRGRWGGEEFVLLLTGVDRRTAQQLLEQLLGEWLARLHPAKSDAAPLTFSGGIAMFPEEGKELDKLLQLADQRLYQAKQAGRARVTS